jgi:hypothetical protein
MRFLVQHSLVSLTGQRDQRRPIDVCISDGSHEVGRSWTERGEANPCATGQTTVNARHESGRLLVTNGKKLNMRRTQCLVELYRLFARQTKHVADGLIF